MGNRYTRNLFALFLILAATSVIFARAQNSDSSLDEVNSLFQQLERSVAEDEAARAESEARQILALLLERMAAFYQITGDNELRHRSLQEAVRASVVSDRAMVRLIEFYLETGRHEEGIETVQNLLSINAIHIQGQNLLGKLQILSGNPLAATHPLRDAYESSGRNPDVGLTLVYAYLEAEDSTTADRLVTEILAAHGQGLDLLVRIGRTYLETGHYAKAIEHFEAAALKAPADSSIQDFLRLARSQLETPAGDRRPVDGPKRSVLLEGLGSPPQALKEGDAAQLASLRQNVAGVYRVLGQAQMQQSAFSSAVQSFTRASFWKPGLEGVELLQATALFRAGNLHRASAILRRRLEKESADRQAVMLLTQVAGAQAQSGELNSARDNVDYLLTLVPESAVLLVLRGRIAAESGALDAALSDFQAALGLDPNLPEANFNSGVIYWKKEDFARALEHFDAELRLNPDHEQAAFRKASILLNRGEEAVALRTLEELTSRRPAFAEPYILLARIQLSQEKLGQAITNLELAAQIEPNRADIFLRLSEVYEKAERDSDARKALDHYRRLTSRTP